MLTRCLSILLFILAPTWLSLRAQTLFLPDLKVEQIQLDQLGQLYLLERSGKLSVYNPLSSARFTFEDTRMSLPSAMDVTNPLGPLLYYADYQVVLLLDRTLDVKAQLDLREQDQIQQPLCFARSFNNQIWVYDTWDYRLKLLDKYGRVERESLDLRLKLGIETQPKQLNVVGELLFLLFEDGRLATFNFMAHFLGWEELKAAQNHQWSQEGLLGWNQDSAWLWDGRVCNAIEMPQMVRMSQQILPWNGGWLVLHDNQLFFYPQE